MTLYYVLAAMILLVMLNNLIESPMCGECGKRFTHADDCWRKREP